VGMTVGARRAKPAYPPTGHRLVLRRRLFDMLSAGGPGGVTLVSAPAGSGKTTLVRSWVEYAGLSDRVAWVSVERGERDAQRFWLSLIGELSTALGAVGEVQELSPAPDFDDHAVVRRLLSDLASLDQPVVLVIDDLHELVSAEAIAQLEFFLARLPPALRVVLATRHDPPLGLHRLRLAGDLTEVRASDLRFAPQEASEMLAADGIVLSETGVAMLHERTEGWAAGLRLAAISLAGNPEPQRFVDEFSGSERTVSEYLLAEVLDRQPAEVRHLLLRTSILERVSGPLADFLTDGSGSERILQELEEANAFVVSLDVGRSWFRYHHLFADLLRLELRRTAPNDVMLLHRAAAEWFAEHGFVVYAIRHAQAAGEWRQAACLLADNDISLALDGRGATVRALAAAFPANASSTDAELARVLAGVEIERGSLDEAVTYFALAERLGATVPDERRPRFDVALGLGMLGVASRRGDFTAALEKSRSLEAALAAQTSSAIAVNNDMRALALWILGTVELWSSRFEEARRDLEESVALARRIGRPFVEIGCLGHLAVAAPSFTRGSQLSGEAIELAERHGWESTPVVGQALAAHANALVWTGRFAEAERWLDRAVRVLRADAEPATGLLLHHTRGLLHAGHGRFEQALAAFGEAEKLGARLVGEHLLTGQLRNFMLQTMLRLGETDAVRAQVAAFAEDHGPSELRAVRAAVHLADGRPQQAVDVLAPVIQDSAPGLEPVEVIQALLLGAVAHDQLGERRGAEAALERALELAEPDGIILPFSIAPIRELMERHPKHSTSHATLLADIFDVLAGVAPPQRGAPAPALEELSDAELRVLRYLPSNLTAPAIAAELHVSANTVKTHMKRIYTKLDTHDRKAAVDRARQLGLLAPSFRRR
jgi:LuxR family maltose regulon positive regulatory protein